MKQLYNFPLRECKHHSFCDYPSTEDQASHQSRDLKSYVRSLSPHKKLDLRESEIISTFSLPTEFDLKYLKNIEDQMDDYDSVKPGIPIVTEEGLSDWCQQSINRRFPVIPPVRPFLMPKAIYEYLRSVQEISREIPTNAAADKELMTMAEMQSIIENKQVLAKYLQPRTMENGTPFIYPRHKNKKKPSGSLESYQSPEPRSKPRPKSTRITMFLPDRSKLELAKHESDNKDQQIIDSIYKLDTVFAKQVLEHTKKKMKFFQNLAFSSTFLNKTIESQKNIHLMIPVELRTPLIEFKDMPDAPSTIEIFVKPLGKIKTPELKEYFDLAKEKKWEEAVTEFKEYLKNKPDVFEAQYGLAMCLERLHCYKLSRKWFIEALKIDENNLDVLFGLAVTSLKLNELGNTIFFCQKTLEFHPSQGASNFQYLLALSYRLLKNFNECTIYYQMILDANDNKMSLFASFHSNDWDEQLKTLPGWIQSRVDIPFFRRFKPKQIKKLCQNKVKKIEALHLFFLEPGFSYIILKGSLKLRDHSKDCSIPKTIWKVQTGQYINYLSHKSFYEGLHYWTVAESNGCILLEIQAEQFIGISRESRTHKEIVNMHTLQSFPIFKDLSLETLEALVIESMKIKKCHKLQVVRKKITDRKVEKKSLFGVIITGICALKREDGLDISLLGRGDCFGEEFVFKNIQGFASLGNIIVKSDNLEVGFISPQDLARLPDYELQKIEQALRNNPHIKRSIEKVNSTFNIHGRWPSAYS